MYRELPGTRIRWNNGLFQMCSFSQQQCIEEQQTQEIMEEEEIDAIPFPAEYYQLVCCDSKDTLKINGSYARFVFTGIAVNDIHPDNLIGKAVTSFTDSSANTVKGCWQFLEADPRKNYIDYPFEEIFTSAECVDECCDCTEKPVKIKKPGYFIPTVHPELIVNNVDADHARSVFCGFGQAMYQKAMSVRYGITFCCPVDLMSYRIDLEIMKMDMTEDRLACCPPASAE